MPEARWLLAECEDEIASRLAAELGISPVIARLLAVRGITTAEEANDFLNPSLDSLHEPLLLPDVEPAVNRLARALAAGEKIMVHGDYDVDGVTSAALLVRVLRALKGDVIYRLPHRRNEGYDIKPAAVDEARGAGVSLIITSDCGVTAFETVKRANELGLDIIVTDHHEPETELPPALAVINPKRHDSRYPFRDLAGVGVAFKLMDALATSMGHRDSFRRKFLDLVALGTVSDVSPLVGENRTLVKFGLEAMVETRKVGLRALLRRSGLEGKELQSYHLSHIIGPRINAVGRLDTARTALDLLLATKEPDAAQLAEALEKKNAERQSEQAKVVEEALERIAGVDLDNEKVLLLCGEGWNTGVVGIAASKIVEAYGRPAILLSHDGRSGICAGSGRSIEQFNLIDALRGCSDLLVRCGGHAHAAGICVRMEDLPALSRRLNEIASEVIKPEDMLPKIVVDAVLEPGELDFDLARQVAALEPFGNGNPEPVFMSPGLEVVRKERVGASGDHLKIAVRSRADDTTECIGFGMGELDDALQLGSEIQICYNLRVNRYNGHESVQLIARDIKSHGSPAVA